MSRIKHFLADVMALLTIVMMMPAAAFAAENSADGRIIIYANVPADWEAPCVWAWADDGTNAFDAWPGGEMEADEANEGWYYCWIPETTDNVIINANAGEVQTADYKLDGQNSWVTVADAETVTIDHEAQTTGDLPEYVETFKIHAQVPDSWESVGLWAWSAPDGTNAFSSWPGKDMTAGENGWYTASAPVWINSIIINGNAGEVQTEDISIDAAEVWVTVADDNSYEFTYNDPDAPVAEDITVYVQAPADWSEPHLWAWSAPDGTNAFSSWPGEALEDNGDGWLSISVPGWINSIIVNGNEGSVQTTDLSVETGKDVWVVVADAENAEVSYEEPEVTAVAEASAETTEAAEVEVAETEASAEAATEETAAETEAQGSTAPIVAGVVAAAAVVGGGGYYISKKKKNS